MRISLKSDDLGYSKGALLFVNFLIVVFIVKIIITLIGVLTNTFESDALGRLVNSLVSDSYYVILLLPLKSILMSTIRKEPFCKSNIQKLRTIGFVVIGFEVLIILVIGIMSFFDIKQISELPIFHNKLGFILGCIILVVSEVFRIGKKLNDENQLTV